MSGASKAIYELVTGIFSTKADDIIDPGPEELTDLAGQVFRSELPQLKDKVFPNKEAMRRVEENVTRSLNKKPKETEQAFETNPMFMEVDETPKQKEKRLDLFNNREMNYKVDVLNRVQDDAMVYDPADDIYAMPLDRSMTINEQMDNLTTFQGAVGKTDPIGIRSTELISFYSTLDNTVDEIFKRTAKNRPGKKGIKGSDLLKRFADSEVKQSELKFINFNSRIKEKEFYTEADLRDVIGNSGIRVVANVRTNNKGTQYGGFQRQIADPMDVDGRTSLVDTGEPVQDLQYFEITLDVFPNFNKDSFDGVAYRNKQLYIQGNLGEQKNTSYTHYNENTLAHLRGSILEMPSQPGGRERGPTAKEKILLIEELQSDPNRVATVPASKKDVNPEKYGSGRRSRGDSDDPIAFSKDEPRSNQGLMLQSGRKYLSAKEQFAELKKENRAIHPSSKSQNENYPKFSRDIPRPGYPDTILVKQGKNVSASRLDTLEQFGVNKFAVGFYKPNGKLQHVRDIDTSNKPIKPAKPMMSDAPNFIGPRDKDNKFLSDDRAIEFTKRMMGDEDYFGTIVKDPQRAERKLPISGDSDYVLKLIQAAIVHAKQNDVDKIVIPSAEMISDVREGHSRGSDGFKFYAKLYEDSVNKALKKLERSFKGKIKTGNYPLSSIDMRFEGIYGDSLKLEKERSSKFLDISKLDLNLEQIMARFSKGGLVTAPSNGLMSR